MATVTGFTAARMLEIENETVVDGNVTGDNLILVTRGGTEINAGNVRGPQGIQGPAGANGTNGTNGVDGQVSKVNNEIGNVYAPRRFANKSQLDAWTSAPDGACGVTQDTFQLWVKRSGVWQPIPGSIVWSGDASIPDIPTTATGLRSLLTFGPGVSFPYNTRLIVNASVAFGYGTGPVSATADITSVYGNAGVAQGPAPVIAQTSAYDIIPLHAEWTVPANQSPDCYIRLNLLAMNAAGAHNYGSVNGFAYSIA